MKTNALSRRSARGFALLTSLMFLLILTTLAVVVLKTSTNNERIAGSDLDRTLAYQLAEATLRDAEQDILGLLSNGSPCSGAGCRPANDIPNKDVGIGDISYIGVCRVGFCYLGPGSEVPAFAGDPATMYDNPAFVEPWNMPDPGVTDPNRPYARFGEFTQADWSTIQANTKASDRPKYWIEVFRSGGNGEKFYFRITVRAIGKNPNTQVMLQEIYEPY